MTVGNGMKLKELHHLTFALFILIWACVLHDAWGFSQESYCFAPVREKARSSKTLLSTLGPKFSRKQAGSVATVLSTEAGGGNNKGGGIGCSRKEGDPWWRGDEGNGDSNPHRIGRLHTFVLAALSIAGIGCLTFGPWTTLVTSTVGLSMTLLGLSATLTWPLSPNGRLVSHHMRLWSRFVLKIMGVHHDVQGLEKLNPDQHYVFASNHESLTDTPLIYSSLPNRHIIAVGKKALSYVPVFGWLMVLGGHIIVDRKNHASALRSMSNAEESLRKNPRSVLVFPEGTRSRDGKLKDFKKGAFVLAINTGLPVVPVAVIGTGDLLHADKLSSERGRNIRLVIGDPIATKGMTYQDRDKLSAMVQRQVKRLRDEGRKAMNLPAAPASS